MRRLLIGAAIAFVAAFLVVPLATVFIRGIGGLRAISDPDTIAALRLTLFVVAVAVPINVVIGIAAAWAIAKGDLPGRRLLTALIDLPLTVSPVISGLVFVLLFGAQSVAGPWLAARGLRVLFAEPALILATVFVTFPYIARVLIPLMQAQGRDEEIAARMLGAGGFAIFWRVTLPNIKWGLLYGIVSCTARAVGEFGAVSVVSGHIRGRTNTAPLHVEALYNEYRTADAFAVASLLALIAVATLVGRSVLERKEPA